MSFRIENKLKRVNVAQLFYAFFFMSYLTSCSDRDDWYITPNEYRGKVTVLYDQKDGAPIKLSGHKHIFEIPPSGILSTKGRPNSGFSHSDKFFRRTPDGV